MILNYETGEFTFSDIIFDPRLSLAEYQKKYPSRFDQDQVSEYTNVKVVDRHEDLILTAYFTGEDLTRIDLELKEHPTSKPYEISAEDMGVLRGKLMKLGGEKEYSWGVVRLVHDERGASHFILIKYQ